ncbi:MAG TPA: ABC transporter ATP-binding protein [Bryobacteraceae bacterium]|nr:ABC transporter ATP-binding protein [Bryobacteraceae bacterium]
MISVQNVSKVYHLYRHPFDRLLGSFAIARKRTADFWALRNVNLRVDKGEVFAILGPNGSGKSTLLQIITGILKPTSGRVLCTGRVAALLELGAGFNPEFSGRDNVLLNGEIMGLSRKELDQAFPKIEAFAEIGRFIDRPVKEYSSGMYVRLAFSTAIHIDPEILIVDEALAVGDAIFASRCIQKFEELRQKKVTVLLVSHDLGLVKRLADRAAFMLEGKVVMEGTPKDAVNQYVGFVLDRERENRGRDDRASVGAAANSSFRHGDGASQILDVRLLNGAGEPCHTFRPGESIVIRIQANFRRTVSDPVVGILVRNRIGMDVFGTNTRLEGVDLGNIQAGETLEIEFELDCLLSRQEYTLTVATQYRNGLSQDWLDDVTDFQVVDTKDVAGVLNLNTRVRHHKLATNLDRDPSGVAQP